MKVIFILLISIIILTGCKSGPRAIKGNFSTITPSQSIEGRILNENIRWSGFVVQTINHKGKICFEIAENETYSNLRPKGVVPNGKHFISCKNTVLESKPFKKRHVIITGTIEDFKEKNELVYPVINTDDTYIWKSMPIYLSMNAPK